MIDLQQFCPKWAYREWMERPFSRAGYTWATDGKLMVRVSLREDMHRSTGTTSPTLSGCGPRQGRRRGASRLARNCRAPNMSPATSATHAGAREHECPDCQCICRACNGAERVEALSAVQAGARAIPLNYARIIGGLDGAEVSPPVSDGFFLMFRFAGGEGIVMLLKANHGLEVVAEI